MLTATFASPVVASPALVFFVTVALPLCAVAIILLLIVCVVSYCPIVPGATALAVVIVPPRAPAVAPAGALNMRPYHVPRTFTKTSRAFLPMTELPVRLKVVMLVVPLPDVALPALVFLSTVALPLFAVAVTAFVIDWLTEVSSVPWPLRGTATETVGMLFASNSSMKPGGNNMSPFRFPSILIMPKNDLPLTTVELRKFKTFATAVAFPLVAFPAFVFAATSASPVAAAMERSFVTLAAVVEWLTSFVPVSPEVGVPDGWIDPISEGSSSMSPVTSPLIVVLKTTAFPSEPKIFPDDCSILTRVAMAVASPVAALPPSVFAATVALPLDATEPTVFVTAIAVAVPLEVLATATALPFGVWLVAVAWPGPVAGVGLVATGPPMVTAPAGGVATDSVRSA